MDGLNVKIDYSDASCSTLRYDSSSGTVSCTNAKATIVFKVRRCDQSWPNVWLLCCPSPLHSALCMTAIADSMDVWCLRRPRSAAGAVSAGASAGVQVLCAVLRPQVGPTPPHVHVATGLLLSAGSTSNLAESAAVHLFDLSKHSPAQLVARLQGIHVTHRHISVRLLGSQSCAATASTGCRSTWRTWTLGDLGRCCCSTSPPSALPTSIPPRCGYCDRCRWELQETTLCSTSHRRAGSEPTCIPMKAACQPSCQCISLL